jgi:hypothetical protein
MPVLAGPPGGNLPGWAPTLERVAAYVPRRALVGAVSGYGEAQPAFSTDTYPTAQQVSLLVADACQWVQLAAGPIVTTLEEAAQTCAAKYAAGYVELGYPDNRDDLSDAKILLDQAALLRKDLAAANIAASETPDDPTTLADNVLPVWSFPEATEIPL